jgi:hypothetical protein
MITSNEGIENLWRTQVAPRYSEHERARPWGITPDSKRLLVWLWEACKSLEPESPAKLFKSSLEQLSDVVGVNVLQPLPPTELKAPEAWRDLWGNPLPNPWATKDLKSQSLLADRDPQLAEWLKKFAESPYAAACEWQDKQAAVLTQKATSYNSDSHAANPFVPANNSSETDKAKFAKNAPAHVVEQAKREAVPITFPVGKAFNLTQQSRISTIPKLNALFNAAMNHEREWREGARLKARNDIAQAQKSLKDLELEAATK